MQIVLHPNDKLREKCDPVTDFGKPLSSLIKDMFNLLQKHNGLGLSAPQVGLSKRLFVCRRELSGGNSVFVNPEFLHLSCPSVSEEGCLSIPDVKKILLDLKNV